MTKKEQFEMKCDLKRRIHIVVGELKHIIDYLEIISDESDELVRNGNEQKIKEQEKGDDDGK